MSIMGSAAELRCQQRFIRAGGQATVLWEGLGLPFTHEEVWRYIQGTPGPTDPLDPRLVKAWAFGLAVTLAALAIEAERGE